MIVAFRLHEKYRLGSTLWHHISNFKLPVNTYHQDLIDLIITIERKATLVRARGNMRVGVLRCVSDVRIMARVKVWMRA